MKIKALEYFLDGNIFAAPIDVDQVVEVSQREYELVVQSGGNFMVVSDDTEVTPVKAFMAPEAPGGNLPLTQEQFDAKQLKEKQEFEARQKAEKEQYDADAKVVQPEFKLSLTDNDGEAQSTREQEELVQKKLAEKRAKDAQAEADAASKAVEPEVKKELRSSNRKSTTPVS